MIELACLLSGAAALVLEVSWQRALASIIGSEARATSLVLAVFLGALACGYRWWGARASCRGPSALLASAAKAELLLAALAVVSPWVLGLATRAAPQLPSGLVCDGLLVAAVVALPAFLMGASIPLLTAALPVARYRHGHARIYGFNTLGACLGAWGSGFWMVPFLGVSTSSRVAGCLELLAALLFARAAMRPVVAQTSVPAPSLPRARGPAPVFVAFAAGAAVMALEVVVTRLFSMAVGPVVFVFPLVLGLFVLGTSVGALTLGRRATIIGEASWAVALLAATYFSVPYWPNWIFLLRHRLDAAPGTFAVFWMELGALAAVLVVPVAVRLGRLLPLCADQARDCGRVYSSNAVGTVLGACGIGYVAAYWLELDGLFKIVLGLLGLVVVVESFAEGFFENSGGARVFGWRQAAAVLVSAAVLAAPGWDRGSYYLGLFRAKTIDAVGDGGGGLLQKPRLIAPEQIAFYREGPDATVAVAAFAHSPAGASGAALPASRSLIINGKTDGNTFGDYPTMALLGLLPYLVVEKPQDLQIAVVGVGTGVTAGVLARLRDVTHVDAIELVSTVVDALDRFREANADLASNPKASIIRSDAFRYFSRAAHAGSKPLDLVVAEPSNPWVAGNETLYTPEFYRLVRERLAPGGAFAQWFHLYEMSEETLRGILANLAAGFDRADAYLLGNGDVVVVAGAGGGARLPALAPNAMRRFSEPGAISAAMRSGVYGLDEFSVLHLFDERYMKWYASLGSRPIHDIDRPWLGARAASAQYYALAVTAQELILPGAARRVLSTPGKAASVRRLLAARPHGLPQCFERRFAGLPLCRRFELLAHASESADQSENPSRRGRDFGWHRLLAYQELRQSGFRDADPIFLRGLRAELTRGGDREMRQQMTIALDREAARE